MKKIHIMFLAILFMSPLIGYSQADITLSMPYKVIDASEKNYLKKGDNILTVKVSGKHIYMQKLDAKNLAFVKVNTFEDMPDGYVLENLMLFNNKCYLFFSLWNRDAKTEQLFYREIDFDNASFVGEEKLLFSEQGKISGVLTNSGFYNFSVTDKFDFFTSFDGSKMIVQYRMKPEEKRDALNKDLIGLRVYGPNLSPVWGDVVQMPYTEKEMNNLDYSVDSDGNAYILTTVFDDNTTDIKKKKEENANYHIELLRVKAFTKVIEKNKVTVGDKFINTVWLYEGPDNSMYCAGFYNNGKSLDNANGIFMFKVGKEGAIYDIKSYEIPVEILNQYVSARTQKKNEKKEEKDKAEFEHLELKEFIIEEDGSIILIGEQHYITTRTTYSSSGSSRTTYVYHFNDILVTKINASGNLAWMKKLPKKQTHSSSSYRPRYQGGMSYTLVKGNDSYYLLFLDNVKNMQLGLDQVPAGHTDGMGGFLTAYKIDKASGQTSKVSVFDTRKVEGIALYQFSVDRILQTNPGEFVVEAYMKKKQDILLKVKLR
jgi:hypothetical protein